MRTNMLLLIFAFLHRNKLFHIKTNLCNGSQIIMRKSFVHEFSTWTYGILLFKKEVALKVFIWERKQRHSIKTRTFARPLVCTHHGHGWVKRYFQSCTTIQHCAVWSWNRNPPRCQSLVVCAPYKSEGPRLWFQKAVLLMLPVGMEADVNTSQFDLLNKKVSGCQSLDAWVL